MGHSNCKRCNGKGQIMMERTAHESAGLIPCPDCKTRTVPRQMCGMCGGEWGNCDCSVVVEQVGGAHYGESDYQHWDWCVDSNMGYLESAASKYIVRWRDKNGIEDLEKAISYTKKAKSMHEQGRHQNVGTYNGESFEKFCHLNGVTGLEKSICAELCVWREAKTLDNVIIILKGIIVTAEEAAEAGGGASGATGQHISTKAVLDASGEAGSGYVDQG